MVKPRIRKTPQKRAYSTKQLALQEEYKYEAELYNRRIRRWIRTLHYYTEPLPSLKEALESKWVIDKKLIAQIKRTRIENLTKSEVRTFERQYTEAYDAGKLDNIIRPKKKMLEPPTEQDFYNEPEQPEQEQPHFETEPEDSEAAIEADLLYFIDGIIEEAVSNVRGDFIVEAERRAETFRTVYSNAVQRVGNKKAFLAFLEDSDTSYRITQVVYEGIQTSDQQEYQLCLAEFANILNNAPITVEQAFSLEMYGVIDFDYTDTQFDLD